ncbi:hypothetical protein Q8A67_020210 [Cirrhinus molitorella]|uniref:Uncharacterized protein n=1 Tax=Cirrhinus molitorella TaxID=172907 RepID=A0AA88P4V4_9TELE|nr:hypothetical protein Q8A67_020210 [Cirrhinus molitorella]
MKLGRASVRSAFPLHWPGSGVLNGPGKSGSPPHALAASQTKLYFNSRKDEMLPLMRVAVYPTFMEEELAVARLPHD